MGVTGIDIPEISIRFLDCELNAASFELRRGRRTIKLERIPLQVLLMLIQQYGKVVTREVIADRIWGKDVFVDVDNGINTAIRKIRQVLNDDPQKPRFVETIAGVGYRFIAPVSRWAKRLCPLANTSSFLRATTR
jgi:DNA-binding winged helix-turn-helix (wHTH) protein